MSTSKVATEKSQVKLIVGGRRGGQVPVGTGVGGDGSDCTANRNPLKTMVTAGGLEPPTLCLKGRCSTPELRGHALQH